MKALSPETARIVNSLRQQKEAVETMNGKTPLTYALGQAISRLSLLDVRYERLK